MMGGQVPGMGIPQMLGGGQPGPGSGGAGGLSGLSMFLNPLLFKSAQQNNPMVNPLFANAMGWKPYQPMSVTGAAPAGVNPQVIAQLRRAGLTPEQIQALLQRYGSGAIGGGAGGPSVGSPNLGGLLGGLFGR